VLFRSYWIKPRDGGIVSFGALMETWSSPDGTEIDSGCILTTAANATLSPIHHRMPVIIAPQNHQRWLDCKTQEPKHVDDLMLPFGDDYFEAIPVGNAVNKVANADPEIQNRVEVEKSAPPASKRNAAPDNDQMDLF